MLFILQGKEMRRVSNAEKYYYKIRITQMASNMEDRPNIQQKRMTVSVETSPFRIRFMVLNDTFNKFRFKNVIVIKQYRL